MWIKKEERQVSLQKGINTLGFRDRLRAILTLKDSPHRLAMAFAVGVFIGMSPLLGLHTVIGIVFAWVFRLNRLVTITGVFITNPWTIVPIYTFCIWVGAKCLGTKHIIPDIDWSHITFSYFFYELKPLVMPFILGTLLIGSILAIISYFFVYHAVKRAHHHGK